VRFMNVAQLELRFNEVIAGVEIAVGFQRRTVTAGWGMNA